MGIIIKKKTTTPAIVTGETHEVSSDVKKKMKKFLENSSKPNTEVKKELKKLIEQTPEAKPKKLKKIATGAAVVPEPKNDAMEAVVAGKAKKDKAKKKDRSKEIESEIQKQVTYLKVSTEQLRNTLAAFIDGPLKAMAEAFVALFVSRGDAASDEAIVALDACRETFDKCGLILADVETKNPDKKPVKKEKK
jgi:hypothetical protein